MKFLRHMYYLSQTISRFVVGEIRFRALLVVDAIWRLPINWFERRVYSQNGEDGLLGYIFKKIGITNKYFVEIGVEDGSQCNSRFLKLKGWKGLQIDIADYGDVKGHFVTVKNVEKVFAQYDVPHQIDLLSIDVDGNDYWIWKAIQKYDPRVVVVEYNSMLGANRRLTIPYKSNFSWDGSSYFGASLAALAALAKTKGYILVATDRMGVNAFFVRQDEVFRFQKKSVKELYHSPGYGWQRGRYGYKVSSKMKQMVSV